MAKMISYGTLVIPAIVFALQKYLQLQGIFEVWSCDKHFQADDIQRLYSQSIGMRHVSSRDQANKEKREGFSLGSSFSLKPLSQEQDIVEFEQAVNGHFTRSIFHDIGPINPQNTPWAPLVQKLENCCFMLVDYSSDGLSPVDLEAWSGLGRYHKWSARADQIRLLPFFRKEEFHFSPEVITSKADGERFFDAVFDHWRKNLLVRLRSDTLFA